MGTQGGSAGKSVGSNFRLFKIFTDYLLADALHLIGSNQSTVRLSNPPPVIRDPITPPSSPIRFAISTNKSSSSLLTSSSPRSESWLAYLNS